MTLTEAAVCGVVQGLAEFLPISSSGHLALIHSFFRVEMPEGSLTFDLLLHLGTLIVVFVFYHKEILSLARALLGIFSKLLRGRMRVSSWSVQERLVLFLIAATIPLAAAPLFRDRLEAVSSYPRLIGILLIVNGALLLLSDKTSLCGRSRALTPAGAFGIGLFQLAATLPGISRSGATISGGLLFGLSREDAVRFSFLLSVPAILGANVMNMPEVLTLAVSAAEWKCYLVGMAFAMLSGFCAMKCLVYISKKSRFGFFAYYCIAVGLLSAILA